MKEFSDFLNKYKSSAETENLVIFGAGTLGRLTLIALNEKGIKVDFQAISDANHFFSKADQGIEKSLNKYIKKESALY